MSLQSAFGPVPMDIVFATRVKADQGPHAMVVSRQTHLWRPMGRENRQIGRAMQYIESGFPPCAQARKHRGRFTDRACEHFAHRSLRITLAAGGDTIFDESIAIKAHVEPHGWSCASRRTRAGEKAQHLRRSQRHRLAA